MSTSETGANTFGRLQFLTIKIIHQCQAKNYFYFPHDFLNFFHGRSNILQECIPVGCVPPTAVVVRGVSTQTLPGSGPPQSRPPWTRHPPGPDTPLGPDPPPGPGTLL